MTEGRVRELASLTSLDLLKADEDMMPFRAEKDVLEKLIRTVAAEARKEGIDEMQDATCFCEKCLIPGHRPLCAVCEAAERLKEKG